jgi:IS5 family transposase
MKAKQLSTAQVSFLAPTLKEQLDPKQALYILSNAIDWDYFEREFSSLYSKEGRPAKPVRLMVGLMILKYLDNLSDEVLVERWSRDPYYQYFCGSVCFQWDLPIDPSDLTYFRRRLGDEGVKKIFKQSVIIHGVKAEETEVVIDSTVQEKNITYPIDSKQHIKIINNCNKIARKTGIKQRRSYVRTTSKLRFDLRPSTTTQGKKRRQRAKRMLKTMAACVVRELERKMSPEQKEQYKDILETYKAFLEQGLNSKNKIYSLHETKVVCYAKGKESKKYEFGSKASILTTKTTGIIVSACNFSESIHDSKTVEATLNFATENTGVSPKLCIGDQGYNGIHKVGETVILTAKSPTKLLSDTEKKERKHNLKRRAAIEPVISHLKSDHRLKRNFLKGVVGDSINLLMAACAFNLKKWPATRSTRFAGRSVDQLCYFLLLSLVYKKKTHGSNINI